MTEIAPETDEETPSFTEVRETALSLMYDVIEAVYDHAEEDTRHQSPAQRMVWAAYYLIAEATHPSMIDEEPEKVGDNPLADGS